MKLSQPEQWIHFLFFSFVLVSFEPAAAQTSQEDSLQNRGTTLVWSDEFEQDGAPNPSNWNYEHGFVRNEEAQWYHPDNARVQGGRLIIEGRHESIENPNYDPEDDDWRINREAADFTSASLLTRGHHSWQFGRFEMRAKIPVSDGLWPAFWTLGVEGSWPENGEIDIMEYYNGHLLANAAWGTEEPYTPQWDDTTYAVSQFDEGWEDQFHTWRMDWDEHRIRLFVDDMLLNEIDLSKTLNPDGSNPFHQPHYLIVNLAIGGTQGGEPDPDLFPVRYEIDYIRVYEWTD